ncbi:MAG: hypothetical protein ACYC0H_17000, partial [Solirubrobacteraceae bacterium]
PSREAVARPRRQAVPRLVPSPARPKAPSRAHGAAPETSLPRRVAAALLALPDHPLLDRLIRGRLWIPVLGVLLAGIVAMQVEVLKLNAGVGRGLAQASALQAADQSLQASVAQLSNEQRIEQLAAAQGMVFPPVQEVGFLRASSVSGAQAAASIHAPDPTGFASTVAQMVQAATSGG